MRGCPNSDIRYCPLYVAAHAGHGEGCMDGEEWQGSSAVDRGMNYHTERDRIAARDPVLVARCAWVEMKETRGRKAS